MPAEKLVLAGDLAVITLPSVVQLVEGEAVTARVVLEGGATLHFDAGRAVGAAFGSHGGLPAFLEAFVRESERFEVYACDAHGGSSLGAVVGLIMEGCRLADEWARLRSLVLAPSGLATDAAPDPVEARLLAAANGRRDAARLIERADLLRSAAIDPLLRLVEHGHLREVAAPAGASEPVVQGFQEAMDAGRAALKAGDYALAERLFSHAVDLRPDDRVAAQNLRRVVALTEDGANPYARWARR